MQDQTATAPLQLVTAPSPHLPVRDDWLALRREPPLDPSRDVVDPHHHLWDRAEPGGRYLLAELLEDIATAGRQVSQTVYVQARWAYLTDGPEELRPVGEVAFVRKVAEAAAGGPVRACDGIVGCADLTLGDRVDAVLEALAEAGGGRLRGIRYPVSYHADSRVRSSTALPPPGLMRTAAFQQGARRVAAAGLSLDVWAYHTQLPEIVDLAERCPAVTIVVNHSGGLLGVGPYEGRPEAALAEWRAGMERLAGLPNIRVKVGGMAMNVSGLRFAEAALPPGSEELAEAWGPVVRAIIDLFGPQRCMFESNFPVDKGMVGYGPLWNAFVRLTQGFSEDDKAALFAGTAREVYRLAPTLTAAR